MKKGVSLGVGNISLVYIYIAAFILFSVWIPHLWLSGTTQLEILNVQVAVSAILAIGVLVPLMAGAFDLSIAGSMSMSSVVVADLLVYHHEPIWLAVALTLGVGVLIGVTNGILVAVIGIDSFIATLGTSSVLSAMAIWLSGDVQISGFKPSFAEFSGGNVVGGIQYQVLYLVVIAILAWYVTERTPVGRYLQAAGENQDAARLAGIRTRRYIFVSLIISATVAAFAGIVETSSVGAGQADLGTPYLLTAFAAAFLGATQFKRRLNVWGTVFAVWVLASGVEGLTLAINSYAWLNDLFFGLALIIAVGAGRLVEVNSGRVAIRRRVQGRKPGPPEPPADLAPTSHFARTNEAAESANSHGDDSLR